MALHGGIPDLGAVPVIDISLLTDAKADEDLPRSAVDAQGLPSWAKLLKELRTACRDWGFFYVINHGIAHETIEEFREQSRLFFQSPKSFKHRVARNENNSRGYFDNELTKQKLDAKEGFDFGAQHGSLDKEGLDGFNQWPDETVLPCFRACMEGYFELLRKLSQKLLEAIALSLGADRDALNSFFLGDDTSFLRLNYYPPCQDPSEDNSRLGVHHHTDAGVLTLLLQDDERVALQVERDGKYYDVHPKSGTFVVNIGDMMQVWSNNQYKAPVHRVLASTDKERHSAPFFYNPSYSAVVRPLPQCLNSGDGPVYHPINWGEFRSQRYAGDYADVGEEVQISHYLYAK